MPAIATTDLSYAYPGGKALHFPDLSLEAGESMLVLGPSGAGKTTFLHLLAGLISPTSGKITLQEQNLPDLSPRQLDNFRGKNIGLVFQKPVFVKGLTLLENLKLARYLAGNAQNETAIRQLMAQLGLGDKAGRKPGRLSQGELQRASLCRALLNQPAVLLADEPTSALDDANAAKVADLLLEQAQQAGAALLIVTHDQRLKDRFARRIEL
ncbi:MAG: ATP-binding cassette domain-containing protein [Bacteroidia bacterium]|nr:ATP-binding cassette domain-containing protein [Bacteroidia bacterium]